MDADDHRALEAGLHGLAGVLLRQQPLERTLIRVATFAAEAIPGADGAGLTLHENRQADTIVASADFVRAVDEVQYRVGEGPCLLAVETGLVQVCGSLGGEARWRRFGPQAGRLGVHSALSLPLLLEGRALGALNVYGRSRDAFDDAAVRFGERFAGPAAVTVANAQVLEESRRLAEQLQQALVSRTTIDQAIGIVMGRSGVDPTEAFERLRRLSQASGIKVAEVAHRLVEQTLTQGRRRHRPADPD